MQCMCKKKWSKIEEKNRHVKQLEHWLIDTNCTSLRNYFREVCVHSTLTLENTSIHNGRYTNTMMQEKKKECRQIARRFHVGLWWSALSFIEPYWVNRRGSSPSTLKMRMYKVKWQKRDNVFVFELKKMRIIMWSSIVHHTQWLEKWFSVRKSNTREEWIHEEKKKINEQQQQNKLQSVT